MTTPAMHNFKEAKKLESLVDALLCIRIEKKSANENVILCTSTKPPMRAYRILRSLPNHACRRNSNIAGKHSISAYCLSEDTKLTYHQGALI